MLKKQIFRNFTFVGASGTGKSTLLHYIQEAYGDKFEVKELSAREFLPKEGSYDQTVTSELQVQIAYHRTLNYFSDLLEVDKRYVYSRSTFCNIGYLKTLKTGTEWLIPTLEEEIKLIAPYFTFLYLPIEFDMDPKDLIRGTNKEVQRETDYWIQEYLRKYANICDIKVISGSIEARCSLLDTILKW